MEDSDSDTEFDLHLETARTAHLQEGGVKPDALFVRLLQQAVLDGREERVRRVLHEGVRPDDAYLDNTTRRTCLFVAAAYGFDNIATALCQAGANANARDTIGWTPALLAFLYGRSSTLDVLQTFGADVSFLPVAVPVTQIGGLLPADALRTTALTGDEYHSTALQALEEIRLLDEAYGLRSRLTLCDRHGRTPLSYAAMMGHESIVEALLGMADAGVEIDVRDVLGLTPLGLAVRRGHTRIAGLLVEAGAELTGRGGHGSLIQTAICRGSMDMVRLLLSHSTLPNFIGTNGNTALIEAANVGHLEATQLLLAKGASVNHQTTLGFTALFMAVYRGQLRIVQSLLESGSDVNHIVRSGDRNVLHMAVARGKRSVLRLLLDYKPLVLDCQDMAGRTALHLCVLLKDSRSARLLLQAGANKHLRECQNETASELAKNMGYQCLAESIANFRLSLQNTCILCIRRSLPTPLTCDVVEQLPVAKPARRAILFKVL